MKNHVTDFIARANFFSQERKNAHGQNIHLTPYLPTISVLRFFIEFVGRKAMDIYINGTNKRK